MAKRISLGLLAAVTAAAMVSPSFADNRVSNSKKGSLLVYSKVELRWACTRTGCTLSQDTFIDMSNDFNDDVDVQLYFVNGDGPTDEVVVGDPPRVVERAHPGWNWADCQIKLTANEPWYMSMYTGLPGGCQPFEVLDPEGTGGPGRPDTDFDRSPIRVLRGFVYAWAVNPDGQQINWNHLSGDALLVNYFWTLAAEYNAYAFQAVAGAQGSVVGAPGVLSLDGTHYDVAYDKLLMDFYGDYFPLFFTDITLHSVTADLRQDNDGPVTTKAKFDIWNQNEVRFSGTEKCITCWDQTLALNYPAPNHLLAMNLQTDKGKARIDGMASTQCPLSVNAALLGVQIKLIAILPPPGTLGRFNLEGSAINFVGQGEQSAEIKYDIIDGPGSATTGSAAVGAMTLSPSAAGGR